MPTFKRVYTGTAGVNDVIIRFSVAIHITHILLILFITWLDLYWYTYTVGLYGLGTFDCTHRVLYLAERGQTLI